MGKNIKLRPKFILFTFFYLIAFCIFYYKYVPLVGQFQIVLIPLLFLVLLITSFNIKLGILFFVFFYPLVNNLPYFFGINRDIPHAPTALVLFLVFLLGWFLHHSFSSSTLSFDHAIFKPMLLLFFVIIISGIITFFRYANYFPFLSGDIKELIVNVNSVRAGGAIMSVVFSCLNYLTGFLFVAILFRTMTSRDFAKKILIVLSFSALIFLLFSLVQRFYSLELGNTSYWIKLGQINSTFKDPNSFGVILSAFLPLLLGMVLAFRKYFKFFFLFLMIIGLFIFPSIGSRSGLLGLGLSAITFFSLFFMSQRASLKKKIVYCVSFLLICVLIFLSFLFFSQQSNLYKRIGWSLDVISNRESLNKLFTRRLDFWLVASNMIKDYPLTGVGVGAYIVEMPNYLKTKGLPFRYTDSAENYFFQIGSELGLIGLLIFVWIIYEIIKGARRSWEEAISNNKDRYILMGAISGLVSIFVNFFFHSYIGSYEVKYFFWFLVALIFVFSMNKNEFPAKTKLRNNYKAISVFLLFIIGTVHLWNSTQSLSIAQRTEQFGWEQNFGLHDLEKDDKGMIFRWTKKSAGLSFMRLGDRLVIPVLASHPDIEENPVRLRVFLANKSFREDRLVKESVLSKKDWIYLECNLKQYPGDSIFLIFDVDRVWQPFKYLGIPDLRKLGIGLGEYWYRYPDESIDGKLMHKEKISYENWEGKYKHNLFRNGSSSVKFLANQNKILLRLHIRGQKAFGFGPCVIMRIDNKTVAKTVISKNGWTTVTLTPVLEAGEHVLSVEFINDVYDEVLKQDRNVLLGDLEVLYLY